MYFYTRQLNIEFIESYLLTTIFILCYGYVTILVYHLCYSVFVVLCVCCKESVQLFTVVKCRS